MHDSKITAIHDMLVNKQISCTELTNEYLAAIDKENGELNAYVKRYKVALFGDGEVPQALKDKLIGMKRTKTGRSALIRAEDADLVENAEITDADLESIMLHYEREGEEC